MPESQEDIDSLLAEVSALADEAVADISGSEEPAGAGAPADGGPPVDDAVQADADAPRATDQRVETGSTAEPGPTVAPGSPSTSAKKAKTTDPTQSPAASIASQAAPAQVESRGRVSSLKSGNVQKNVKNGDATRILKLEVPVIVRLAETLMPVSEIVSLSTGSIIEFEKPSESELNLMINNKCIGRGQPVKVGENFGLRITHIGTIRERIKALGE